MTILDCCISLKRIKNFGCVGSCGYAPASVKKKTFWHLPGCKLHYIVLFLSLWKSKVYKSMFLDSQFSVPNPNQVWNYSAEPALPAGLAGTRSCLFFLLEKGTQYGNGRSRQNLYSLRPFCKATWCWIGNWLILNLS